MVNKSIVDESLKRKSVVFTLLPPVFPHFGSFSVGDGACCARAEVQDLCHEGGERAAISRAPGADQAEDQARAEGQGPAGRAGRQQRTEGTEASHLRHSAHVMLHQQRSPTPNPSTITVCGEGWEAFSLFTLLNPVTSWKEAYYVFKETAHSILLI